MKPIIGIVVRPHKTETNLDCMMVLDSYRRAVILSGGVPLFICPTQNVNFSITHPKDAPRLIEEEKEDLLRQLKLCDGIIMPGGSRMYDYDLFITDYAYKNDVPVFGICLGMQIMVSYLLKEEIRTNVLEKIDVAKYINHNELELPYVHNVSIKEDSIIYKILGKKEIRVNSRHKYVAKNDVYDNFDIIAFSEEGFPEGIEVKNKRFFLGVQWHPETMYDYDENMRKIFEKFINEAKEK